jgi:RNA polymerase sigma-70 factor (ECF subfamily)
MTEQRDGKAPPGPDNLSLDLVIERYQAALLRYATRLLNNPDLAQDVVQDAFIRLHANWDDVVGRGMPLKGWLFRTTHNAAVDLIRKESRRRLLHQRQAEPLDYSTAHSEHEDPQRDRKALVLAQLHALKPKEREVLVLRLQEEMSYREIAVVIQRSEGYVGTLIHAATKKLSQRLRQAGVVS